jgi:hypothetical protein
MRKLLLSTTVFAVMAAGRPAPAHADFGLGVFLGEPTGLDFKLGLGNQSALDFVLGFSTFDDGRAGYGHVTYLVTPVFADGRSVIVPLRLGIGAELIGPSGHLSFGIRAPVELGLRLRRTPLEFYGEIALAVILIDPADEVVSDLQGGIGFRLYF